MKPRAFKVDDRHYFNESGAVFEAMNGFGHGYTANPGISFVKVSGNIVRVWPGLDTKRAEKFLMDFMEDNYEIKQVKNGEEGL